jgi:hypothetical protein
MADAETAFTEALAIRRELAQRDPGAYRPDVAMTLNNLGILYRDTGRMADAETAFTEVLVIYHGLAQDNPAFASRAAAANDQLTKLRDQILSSTRH